MDKYQVGQHITFYDENDDCDIECIGEVDGIITKLYEDTAYSEGDRRRWQMHFDQVDREGNRIDSWWGYCYCITNSIPVWAQKGD